MQTYQNIPNYDILWLCSQDLLIAFNWSAQGWGVRSCNASWDLILRVKSHSPPVFFEQLIQLCQGTRPGHESGTNRTPVAKSSPKILSLEVILRVQHVYIIGIHYHNILFCIILCYIMLYSVFYGILYCIIFFIVNVSLLTSLLTLPLDACSTM